MAAKQDLEWVKSTTNELNNLLQVITESSQFLEKMYGGDANTQKYFEIIRNGVERASLVTRQMLDRAGEAARGEASPAPEKTRLDLHPAAEKSQRPAAGAINIANP